MGGHGDAAMKNKYRSSCPFSASPRRRVLASLPYPGTVLTAYRLFEHSPLGEGVEGKGY